MTKIYLDYAATTPLDERVLDAMLPYFRESFGNPSSVHWFGQIAEAAIEDARETVAALINCQPGEIIFTSCGSESDNLALRGVTLALFEQADRIQILTSQTEHPAVSKTARMLTEKNDIQIKWLDIDKYGMVKPEAIEKALGGDTKMASVMYANNEIGTINPIQEIADLCHQNDVIFHTDAVQAAAYLPVDVDLLGADLISLGAHKFYGPKGIGALYIRKDTPLLSTITGGGQERGLRSGTSNVPYIIGFAEALRLTIEEREERIAHVKPLRDIIVNSILDRISDSRLTGHPESRLPNHASFVFKNVDGNFLLQLLDAQGFACSSGSACKTGNPEPSEVISELGLRPEWGLGSLRITLGSGTTTEQVDSFLRTLPSLVEKARGLN